MLERIQTNDSKPRVTVAILAYYEHFLDECISSVLSQTYRNIKIIVCDDCSPYDLKSVFDRFNDPRLIYRRNPSNLGELGNSNNALDLCDTEYINIMHGDDVMFPWMIEKLVDALDTYPSAGMAFSSRYYSEGSDGNRFRDVPMPVLYIKRTTCRGDGKTRFASFCCSA